MDASDEQFQVFIASAGLPVDDQGITEWSFDDRCGVINHALKHGIVLPFVDPSDEQKQFTSRIAGELFDCHKGTQEEG